MFQAKHYASEVKNEVNMIVSHRIMKIKVKSK